MSDEEFREYLGEMTVRDPISQETTAESATGHRARLQEWEAQRLEWFSTEYWEEWDRRQLISDYRRWRQGLPQKLRRWEHHAALAPGVPSGRQ